MRLGDPSLLIDDIGDAFGVFVARRIRGAVGNADAPVGVAEQREGEVELLRESGVVGNVVKARSEDRGVLRFVFVDEVPEPGTLSRSTRGIGFRIEPEHDLASAQTMQGNHVPAMVGYLEIRSLVAHFEHLPSSEGLHRIT